MQYFHFYLFLILAFILNAAANILIKVAAGKRFFPTETNSSLWNYLTHNKIFLLALFAFGLNAVFYYIALRAIPLLAAYPIMVGMSFLIISFFSVWYLHEKITLFHVIGILMILTGITSILYKSAS